ncbi:single-stranded-DNA-specific exonuclease RecJ [Bartonella sp. DGB2]|uniref:single-stranded-DNA-specific exonuclease RecJ n=1 Tax=Bartonella sp. DGB2 TaxID=3388426 RepID=UPI00398FD16A
MSFFLNVETSIRGYRWLDALDAHSHQQAMVIAQKYNVPDIVARVLTARGVKEAEVSSFIEPRLRTLLPNPAMFAGMDAAIDCMLDALVEQKSIVVFGDYDVDGACSSAILARFFSHFGLEVQIYIPSRQEGYGPNPQAMKRLASEGAQLIITVDCGSNSVEAIRSGQQAGARVVVLDHHQITEAAAFAAGNSLADALVNPNRVDDTSEQGHLCAAGVVFVTLVGLCKRLRESGHATPLPDLLAYLDLVALATICDVVPLKGVNRAFVRQGLEVARKGGNVGLAALIEAAAINVPLKAYHLGYVLGPRINAGGRIGDQALGSILLSTSCRDTALSIAHRLSLLNEERQVLEREQLHQALVMVQNLYGESGAPPALVVAHEAWHAGIVGLLASRLKDRFSCPTIAIALQADGTGVGSARSVTGVDMSVLIEEAVALGYLSKGGGHKMAAGLTLAKGQLGAFVDWFLKAVQAHHDNEQNKKSLVIDGSISAAGANVALVGLLEQAGPFGTGNPAPVFAVPGHRLIAASFVGGQHVRCSLANFSGQRLEAIAFRAVNSPLGDFLLQNIGEIVHLVGQLELNEWNGRTRVQLQVLDAAPAKS